MVKKLTSVRVDVNTVEKLKNLHIEMGGVELNSVNDKLNHLMWYYSSHKNNNGNNKTI